MVQGEGILPRCTLLPHEPAEAFVHVQIIGQSDTLIESLKLALHLQSPKGRDEVL